MTKRAWPALLPACLLLLGLGVTLAAGAQQTPPPITEVNVHQLGPQRLGPLPPVVAPPNNPPMRVFGEGPMTVQQVADAIAAFERTVVTTDSRFDRYARGNHGALHGEYTHRTAGRGSVLKDNLLTVLVDFDF